MVNLSLKFGVSEIRKVYSYTQGKTVTRLIVSLPGAGCEYQKKSGGCSMCGFHKSTEKYTRGHIFSSSVFKLLFNNSLKLIKTNNISEVYIFNGGSFLNNNEIPFEFQKYVLNVLNNIQDIKVLFVESRVEYITEKKLKVIESIRSNYDVIIGIGFESQNDYIRNKVIKKSLSKKSFEKTVSLISRFNLKSSSYVFFKPPGLSEKESYNETIKTINYLLNVGITELILSTAFVQKDTPLYEEYKKGNFKPPYLWSVISLIKFSLANEIPLTIGGFSDNPKPVAIAKNCNNCSNEIYQIIDKFRQNKVLSNIPNCSCINEYEKIML